MTSNDVILSIKLFLEVGNDKYNIMCNFGGHNLSAFVACVAGAKRGGGGGGGGRKARKREKGKERLL